MPLVAEYYTLLLEDDFQLELWLHTLKSKWFSDKRKIWLIYKKSFVDC